MPVYVRGLQIPRKCKRSDCRARKLACRIGLDRRFNCSGCYYFISVYGYEEALYTILATVKSDEAVVIYPGMPQSDQVSESGVNNYAFEFIRTDSSTDSASEQVSLGMR